MFINLENDIKSLFPELYIILAICSLLVFGATYGTQKREDKGSALITIPMVYLSSLTMIISSFLFFNGKFEIKSLLYGTLYIDSLSINGKGFLFLVSGICLLVSLEYLLIQGIYAFEYSLLILIATFGLGLLLSSNDFLSLYLSLELQSLALYVLASFKRGSAFSTEAGLKYFVVGAFSSGLLLFGISLIYGATGTINFEDLNRLFFSNLNEVPVSLIGGIFFISTGLMFKLAVAPIHIALVDVYTGAPSSSSMYFAAVPKLAILIVFLRLYYTAFYGLLPIWQNLILFFSILSIVIAALGTLQQRQIKRFLAYSSISHVSYILIGLATGSLQGIESLLVYTLIYITISISTWIILLTTFKLKNEEKLPIQYLDELVHIPKKNPALAFTITVSLFSIAGVPPLAGFIAKYYVFFSAIESSLYLVGILGVLTSVVSAYYYLRWVKVMYFDKEIYGNFNKFSDYQININKENSIVLSITTFIILFFFYYPKPFLLLTHNIALSLSL